MANDPGTLILRLAGFQLFNKILKDARLVWICEVEIVKDIVDVPISSCQQMIPLTKDKNGPQKVSVD